MRMQTQRASDPLQLKYGSPIHDRGWDTFFASLQQKADDASAAGMHFKVAMPRGLMPRGLR